MGRFVVLALIAAALVGVAPAPAAWAAAPSCPAGTHGTRLADDPAGDTTYAGEPDPGGATDGQEDLRFVDASLDAGTVRFTVGVEDLGTTDPPASVGLLVSLDILTASGETFAVDASRSVALMDPGTGSINGTGAAGGVTATFDAAANTITVAGPESVLPEDAASFALTNAETRADGGEGLAPLTDTAAGSCTYTFGTPPATAPFDRNNVTVTVIDTGITASNPEFDYDESVPGPNGQMVGWWDFSGTTSHDPCGPATAAWCTAVDPYDPDLTSGSHGTGTTGMAAGTNASPVKTPSACPGCRLAVAKVLNEDGDSLDGSPADAIYWAVDVIDTDVISVSIGAVAPIPEPILHDTYVAQRYAREHGVFVVFSNGNGWGNAGVPGQPGGFMNYGNSVDVLSVGAAGLDGLLVTTDPEVTAAFTVMTSASPEADTDGTDDGYHSISGTSFSAPFTAGLAAHVISSGRLCGASNLSPAYVEQLVKDTAIDDPAIPPSNEGYGEVDASTLATALDVLCNGAARPVPETFTKLYTDHVSGTERMVSGEIVSGWTLGGPTIVPLGNKAATRKSIGVSTPVLADSEIYQTTLAVGQTLDATFTYVGGDANADFDVYVYDVTSGVKYDGKTILTKSASEARIAEHVVYRNTTLKKKILRIVVVGFTITTPQTFKINVGFGLPVSEGLAGVTVSLV